MPGLTPDPFDRAIHMSKQMCFLGYSGRDAIDPLPTIFAQAIRHTRVLRTLTSFANASAATL